MKYLSLCLICLCWISGVPVKGQDDSIVMISMRNNCALIGVDNLFWVETNQSKPINPDQLTAVLLRNPETQNSEQVPLSIRQVEDHFVVRPLGPGIVEISVQQENENKETFNFNVQPITAVAMFGVRSCTSINSLSINLFRNQRGLYMVIENLDVPGRCTIISYEVIRITKGSDPRFVMNAGGDFQPEARELIGLAQPGDRYIFTKIRYRCPGALVDQLGNTLSFELK